MAPTPVCLKRVKKDIRELLKEPLDGVFITVDETSVTKVHALIVGPADTPYAGGFFYFVLDIPDDFPNQPPKAEIITTDGGRCRFNPNLYPNGKVCLSILGTWTGPGWSPALSLSSVLLSIQSLMNDRPYCNEPGYEEPKNKRDVEFYNEIITHETIRVAFCDQLEDTASSRGLPSSMKSLVRDVGPSYIEQHEDTCLKHLAKDGMNMIDPHGGQSRGKFQWKALLERLRGLKAVLGDGSARDADGVEDEVAKSGEGLGGAPASGV